MRNAIFLVAFALCAGTAWSQAGGHVGAPSLHVYAGKSAAGPAPSGRISMGGHAAPFHPSQSIPRSTPTRTSRVSSLDTQGNWTSSGFIPSQNGSGSRYNNDHHSNYGYGPVGYPIFPYPAGYLNGGLNIDDNDPNDPNLSAGSAANSYVDNAPPYANQDQGYYGPPETARAPYNPGSYESAGAPALPSSSFSKADSASSDGMGHPRVTLIFKDGRTPLKIQNYAMSQTKIFIRDNGTDRDIAISDLDVPATMSANDQAGVNFELPVAR